MDPMELSDIFNDAKSKFDEASRTLNWAVDSYDALEDRVNGLLTAMQVYGLADDPRIREYISEVAYSINFKNIPVPTTTTLL